MFTCEELGFTYPGGEAPTLRNVSFSLEPGSFHFLTGPSGAGKTTLFRLMHLDLFPTSGRLEIFGNNVKGFDRDRVAYSRRRMGLVFQDYRLLDNLTVKENVELPLGLHGPLRDDQRKAVLEILDWVGLSHHLDTLPPALSGGEKQRVAIARAVVNRPELLLADEPTGNLDDHMGAKILHLFCELHRHGTTVLVATHNQELVRQFGFPCLYVQDGRLIGRTEGAAPGKRGKEGE